LQLVTFAYNGGFQKQTLKSRKNHQNKDPPFTWANIYINFKHKWGHEWRPKGLGTNGGKFGDMVA